MDRGTLLRKLREGLALLAESESESDANATAQTLHRIERLLGPTRDDDVFVADLDARMRKGSPDVMRSTPVGGRWRAARHGERQISSCPVPNARRAGCGSLWQSGNPLRLVPSSRTGARRR